MKTSFTLFSALFVFTTIGFGQTQNYDINIGATIGLEQTSGDICTASWVIEEAKQIAIGNTWGCSWTSVNAGNAVSVAVEVMFTVSDGVTPHPTTLNGMANNSVDPGAAVNCAQGTLLTWNIDPTNYIPMGLNTFLVDYSSSSTINQLDNLPIVGDPYIRVTVEYEKGGVSVANLNEEENFEIYPNPALDVINIDLGDSELNGEIIISNSLGQVVNRILCSQSQLSIDIADLKNGIYILDYTNANGQFTKRFAKI